ncbi:MAG: PIN domain-containing protein [Pseudomonadales bacterium]
MTYLVDANVLSEPTRVNPNSNVITWLRENERRIWIDPIVLGEIRFGILLLNRGAKRRRLEGWFDEGVARIRCTDWDAATGLRWAQLIAALRIAGRSMPVKDSLIAATAFQHELVLVTRDQANFERAGLSVVNPFE